MRTKLNEARLLPRPATVLIQAAPQYTIQNLCQLTDNLSWTKGKHSAPLADERARMGPLNWEDLWNPKVRRAICFNPPATPSVLPITSKMTEFVLAGLTKAQMTARRTEAVTRKELPVLEAGSVSYMMAKGSYLGDAVVHWHPHLMFYGNRSDGTQWGADAEHSPVFLNPQFQGAPEPLTTYVVVAPKSSDGTPAPLHNLIARKFDRMSSRYANDRF
jgi:hypothetical protein